jgi:hypothetical protein
VDDEEALEQVPAPPLGDPTVAYARGRRRARRRHLGTSVVAVVGLVAVAVAGIVSWTLGTPPLRTIADRAADACPVIDPSEVTFIPPEPYPSDPGVDGSAWYGSSELWTVVSDPPGPRKSVWWSAGFVGSREGRPDLDVVYERLDDDGAEAVVLDGPATNAHSDEHGWFMIAGLQPDEPGCWQATARYGDSELRVVFEVAGPIGTSLPLPARGGVFAAFVEGQPVFVVHDVDGAVRVLDAVSPHRPGGFTKVLAWCETSGRFEDLWHGSQFDRIGTWVAGPAPTGMASYEVVAGAATVSVGSRGQPPERGRDGDQPPPSGPGCGERTALYLPEHAADPTVLDDLVNHGGPGTRSGLWFPTPERIRGETAGSPS